MAKAPTLKDVSSGYASNTQLEFNFDAIGTSFENTLSLDGSTPNAMGANLDMNSNNITNVGTIASDNLTVGGVIVTDATYVPNWEGPWVTSTAYVVNDLVSEAGSSYICLVAHTSGTFSTDLTAVYWEIFAKQGSAGAGTGDMLAANNLSDVASVVTSRSNLGLGTLAVQNSNSVTISGGAVTGITDITIADGGTGSSTASAAFTALKQAATTSDTGVVERSTSTENIAGTDDTVYPTVAGTKEMIDTHTSGGGAWTAGTETTLSSDATADFTVDLSTYTVVRFVLRNVIPATDDSVLQVLASIDSGSNYNVTCTSNGMLTASGASFNDTATTGVPLVDEDATKSIGSFTDEDGWGGSVEFSQTSGKRAVGNALFGYENSLGNFYAGFGSVYIETTSAVTNIRFKMDSGNLATGTIQPFYLTG